MSEQENKLYSPEEALKEADLMREKIKDGVKDYNEIEKKVVEEYLDIYNFRIENLKDIPLKYHKEIALKLIEAQQGQSVAENLEKFSGLDHKEIVLKLIEAGEGHYVAEYLEKFSGLDFNRELALKLIEGGEGWGVVKNLEKFSGLDHKEITLKLIEAQQGRSVAFYLDKFSGLDREVALKLIESGQSDSVAHNLGKFPGLDREIALKLIEAGKGRSVAFYLEKFSGLDFNRELAFKLIEAQQGQSVAKNLEKFSGLDHKEIVLKLIEAQQGQSVAKNLEKFSGLDHKEIALKLIEAKQDKSLVEKLDKFSGMDKEIALKLTEAGKGDYVAEYLEKFSGLDREVALKLIESGQKDRVSKNLDKFSGLDREIALKLIEVGKGDCVAEYLEKFSGLDHKEIALKLIEAREGWDVAHNLDKFSGLDFNREFAFKLIEGGVGWGVVHNLEKFSGLDHKEIALKLIEAKQGKSLVENLDKFSDMDKEIALKLIEAGFDSSVAAKLYEFPNPRKEIALKLIETGNAHSLVEDMRFLEAKERDKEVALKLIESGQGEYVARHLEDFSGLDKEVALKLIESGQKDRVSNNLYKFSGLDKEVALKLIEKRKGWGVVKNLEKFSGLDHKEIALKLIEAQQGQSVAENLEKFSGLDHKEIALKLIEARQGQRVAENLDKFDGLDNKEIILKLIEVGDGKLVADTISETEERMRVDLDEFLDQEVALKLFEAGEGWCVGNNINKFAGLNYNKEFAFKLIEVQHGRAVAENLDKFSGLNHQEIAFKLIEIKQGAAVAENLDKFSGYINILKKQLSERKYTEYLDKIKRSLNEDQIITLDSNDFEYIENDGKKLNALSFAELNFLKEKQKLDKCSLKTNEEAQKIYQELKEKTNHWRDSEVNKRFEMGAEIFGYHKMFEFAKPGSRHDALYRFDKIIELYQKSGLSEKQFFNNILHQVASQDGMIGEATYYQTLNDIVSGFEANYEKVFQEAKEYNIAELNKLIAEIGEAKNIFNSFQTLRNFHELCKQLQMKDLLKKIKDEPNEELKNYISTLLFHPTIENKQAIIRFYENPGEFLGLDSSHTSEEIHDRKKPSNYIEIPNLDLTAIDMRDALVEGAMDKIQVWQPLEIYYELPQNLEKYQEFASQNIKKIISEALGKRGEIKGKVNNPDKMAKAIANVLQIKLSDLSKIIKGEIEINEEQKNKIVNLLYFDKFGYANKTERYLAKVNLKSDPDGVVAGNDTKCCMPFGDGKNTLYTYNPICALFTLQKETGDNKYATIGQSVLTKDKNIGVPINILRESLENDQMKLQELISEDVLRQTKSIIAADSVEVNANYHSEKYAQIIADLYKDFFKEYVARFSKEQNLDPSKVVTGSCSYQLKDVGSETNYYIPESPVAYSDKYKENVWVLNLTKAFGQYFKKRINEEKIKNKLTKEEVLIETANVQYLTFQDTLPTAYLEGKIYQGTSMSEGLHNMENGLIAKDINNAKKDRANMSLKYINKENKMQGYLLAYEGKINQDQLEESEWNGRECIYVADLAKDPKSIKAGVALVNAFVELYIKNYLDKDKPLPIVARMRDTTSFRLVSRKLEQLTTGTKIKFVMEEISTEQDGDDLMHWVVIRPE